MPPLSARRAAPDDLEPLSRLLHDPEALSRTNPSAKHPFDPLEWRETWLSDPDDAVFYVVDDADEEVGFFALRPGIGPEQRHLAYVYLAPAHRGGGGARMVALAEDAARRLGAATLTLKVETDNPPALGTYRAAGYEELGESGGVATMRRDLA